MKIEEKASMPLAGGIANLGYQCGLLWGAALAAGAQAHRLYGSGPQAETAAITATQRLVESFRSHTRNKIDCLDISGLNMQGKADVRALLKYFLRGGPIGCFRLAARYAPDVHDDINATFAQDHFEVPSPPVSCAGLLAHKMGASDMHKVMVAGFAGGIGLSGGGCGALGAAIWITGMNNPSAEIDGFSYSGTWIGDMIDKYLESADHEFECSKVTGRKFENIAGHADYLRAGGCSAIFKTLTAFSEDI